MKLASVATGLNQAKAAAAKVKPASETGKPLEIPVADIQENPNNPRTEFEPIALQELADNISVSGVISPISVFKNPTGSDKPYTLNYGARRLKASLIAKKSTIPAIVTVELDAYQRVAENEQREGLGPMELAEFIQDRLANHGESQKQVAKQLGKPESVISDHVKLLQLDETVKAAFERGQIAAARAAVDLSNLIAVATDSGVEAITERLESDEPVTRTTVAELKNAVKTKGKKGANSSGRIAEKPKAKSKPKNQKVIQPLSTKAIQQINDLQPVITVKLGRRNGRIAFNVPSKSSKSVWVRFDDDENNIEQVKCSDLQINVIAYEATTTGHES